MSDSSKPTTKKSTGDDLLQPPPSPLLGAFARMTGLKTASVSSTAPLPSAGPVSPGSKDRRSTSKPKLHRGKSEKNVKSRNVSTSIADALRRPSADTALSGKTSPRSSLTSSHGLKRGQQIAPVLFHKAATMSDLHDTSRKSSTPPSSPMFLSKHSRKSATNRSSPSLIKSLRGKKKSADFSNKGLALFPELPSDVKKVDVSHNRLSQIPVAVTQLPLKSLLCAYNRFAWVTTELAGHASLTELDFAHNRIKAFPDVLFHLPNLQELNLRGNPIGALPKRLLPLNSNQPVPLSGLHGHLVTSAATSLNNSSSSLSRPWRKLRKLDVSRCSLSQLPTWLATLPVLETLRADSNRLQLVSPAFANAPRLVELHCRGNRLAWPIDASNADVRHMSGTQHSAWLLAALRHVVARAREARACRVLVLGTRSGGKSAIVRCLAPSADGDAAASEADSTEPRRNSSHDDTRRNSSASSPGAVRRGSNVSPSSSRRASSFQPGSPPADRRGSALRNVENRTPFGSLGGNSSSNTTAPTADSLHGSGNRSSAPGSSLQGSAQRPAYRPRYSDVPGALRCVPLEIKKHKVAGERRRVSLTLVDFDGRQVAHGLHQVFITRGAVALIVWDMRTDAVQEIRQLLDDVKALSGVRAPVIIVGTHVDDPLCTQTFVDGVFQRLLQRLGPSYQQNIQTCVPVSCSTGENVEELRKLLAGVVAAHAPDAVQSLNKHHSPPRLRTTDSTASSTPTQSTTATTIDDTARAEQRATYRALYHMLGDRLDASIAHAPAPVITWSQLQSLAEPLRLNNKRLLSAITHLHCCGRLIHKPLIAFGGVCEPLESSFPLPHLDLWASGAADDDDDDDDANNDVSPTPSPKRRLLFRASNSGAAADDESSGDSTGSSSRSTGSSSRSDGHGALAHGQSSGSTSDSDTDTDSDASSDTQESSTSSSLGLGVRGSRSARASCVEQSGVVIMSLGWLAATLGAIYTSAGTTLSSHMQRQSSEPRFDELDDADLPQGMMTVRDGARALRRLECPVPSPVHPMIFALLQSHDLAHRIAEHDPASVAPAFVDVTEWESIASANSEDSERRVPSLTGSSDRSLGGAGGSGSMRSRGNSDSIVPLSSSRHRHSSNDTPSPAYSHSPLNSSDHSGGGSAIAFRATSSSTKRRPKTSSNLGTTSHSPMLSLRNNTNNKIKTTDKLTHKSRHNDNATSLASTSESSAELTLSRTAGVSSAVPIPLRQAIEKRADQPIALSDLTSGTVAFDVTDFIQLQARPGQLGRPHTLTNDDDSPQSSESRLQGVERRVSDVMPLSPRANGEVWRDAHYVDATSLFWIPTLSGIRPGTDLIWPALPSSLSSSSVVAAAALAGRRQLARCVRDGRGGRRLVSRLLASLCAAGAVVERAWRGGALLFGSGARMLIERRNALVFVECRGRRDAHWIGVATLAARELLAVRYGDNDELVTLSGNSNADALAAEPLAPAATTSSSTGFASTSHDTALGAADAAAADSTAGSTTAATATSTSAAQQAAAPAASSGLNTSASRLQNNMPGVFVVCTRCQLHGHAPATRFALNEVLCAVASDAPSLPCPQCGAVALDELAPDQTLCEWRAYNLSTTSSSSSLSLRVSRCELARNDVAVVRRARLGSRRVALKRLIEAPALNSATRSAPLEAVLEWRREIECLLSLATGPAGGAPPLAATSANNDDYSGACFVTPLLGFLASPPSIALPLARHGDLYHWLRSDAPISQSLRMRMALDIARGLSFLHNLTPPLIHADFKSPNVLVFGTDAKRLCCRIADFGSATRSPTLGVARRCAPVTNPTWAAPETLGAGVIVARSDVYALGIVLWELATRAHPFADVLGAGGVFMARLELAVTRGVRPTMPTGLPRRYTDVIRACWQTLPRRPTSRAIVKQLFACVRYVCEPNTIAFDSTFDSLGADDDLSSILDTDDDDEDEDDDDVDDDEEDNARRTKSTASTSATTAVANNNNNNNTRNTSSKRTTSTGSTVSSSDVDENTAAPNNNAPKHTARASIDTSTLVQCLLYVRSRDQIWCGGRDGSISVYDALSGELVHCEENAHTVSKSSARPSGVLRLCWAGQAVWSAGIDGLRVWEALRFQRRRHSGYLLPSGAADQQLFVVERGALVRVLNADEWLTEMPLGNARVLNPDKRAYSFSLAQPRGHLERSYAAATHVEYKAWLAALGDEILARSTPPVKPIARPLTLPNDDDHDDADGAATSTSTADNKTRSTRHSHVSLLAYAGYLWCVGLDAGRALRSPSSGMLLPLASSSSPAPTGALELSQWSIEANAQGGFSLIDLLHVSTGRSKTPTMLNLIGGFGCVWIVTNKGLYKAFDACTSNIPAGPMGVVRSKTPASLIRSRGTDLVDAVCNVNHDLVWLLSDKSVLSAFGVYSGEKRTQIDVMALVPRRRLSRAPATPAPTPANTGSGSGSGTSGKRRRRTAGSSGSSGNGGVHASSVDCIDETLVCVVGSHIVMLPATSLLAVTSPFTSADSSGGRAASGTMSSSSSNIVNASVMSVDAAGTKRLRTLAPGWPGALLIADDEGKVHVLE